ncbi:hypothetical protein COCSADRAFT_93397 [Bipolaris sorokiniana ND90Pr]|uniref:Uncharacterized protein n=1 Tax=Cochliobolus sativus (strain ND90Pr / ATCC 201652) TaxID=665912 RepID=M2SKC8_COCSN|nr:uncharacterized protein COCSADRAFT_93397 [Bipolaris sorokiniana ND90Pr]EMD62775.1 hypothetical protein COCSADRAFT_93397 [Bipolaris sorokiniana ND90Pr]
MLTSNLLRTLTIVGSIGFLKLHIITSLLREHSKYKIVYFNRSECGKRRTISALQKIIGDISSAWERLKFLVTSITSHAREPGLNPIAELIPQVSKLVFNA